MVLFVLCLCVCLLVCLYVSWRVVVCDFGAYE